MPILKFGHILIPNDILVNRRRFVVTAASGAAGFAAGCISPGDPIDMDDPAHLVSRPVRPTKSPATGRHPLGLGIDRDGFMYVSPDYSPARPASLIVLLHGAGQSSAIWAGGPLDTLFGARNIVVVAPDSRGGSWDVRFGYGPDVEFIDYCLSYVFDRCAIDPASIALAGFSDGASYALSLGATNGDLFTHVIGFSPGFYRPDRLRGKPKIFLSHGTADPILPFAWTSTTLAPLLTSQGYNVKFEQFDGGHTVPLEIATDAMDWFKGN
jgi:predicted esterase